MEPVGTALPELDGAREEEVPTPCRRERHLARVARIDLGHKVLELLPGADLAALCRCHGRQLGAARARAPVRQRLLLGEEADWTADPHLPIERRPPERGGRPWIHGELPPLSAGAV